MTQTDKMLSRKEGGIGYLIFNNPDRLNAVSLDMWAATDRILEDFRNDGDVRVVVVTGAGGKAFVSGADISEFEKQRSNQEQVDKYNATSDKAFTGLYEFPKPTIAMILRVLHRRRARTCHVLRHADLLRQFQIWHPGRQARPRLRLCRHQTPGRSWSGRHSPRKSSTPRVNSTPKRRV